MVDPQSIEADLRAAGVPGAVVSLDHPGDPGKKARELGSIVVTVPAIYADAFVRLIRGAE